MRRGFTRGFASMLLGLVAGLCQVGAAAAVDIEWVTVGDPGNLEDYTGDGAVSQVYRISKYEITQAQYADYLNAIAKSDPKSLYSSLIDRTGGPGNYSYEAREEWADHPIGNITYWRALRFANWLHNSQPQGAQDETTTEGGAYTITADAIENNLIARNPEAQAFIPNTDEWYKAAYYDPVEARYYDYPAGTNQQTTCSLPGTSPNSANCNEATGQTPVDVGSYTGSASPMGTFDQGGSVQEWIEAGNTVLTHQLTRGGSFITEATVLKSDTSKATPPTYERSFIGLRVALPIPRVEIDWRTIHDWGNAADGTGYGAVSQAYRISEFEITNAQYAVFLNAVAAADTHSLYDAQMSGAEGGIVQNGISGHYIYTTIAGREDHPVNFVSFWDAARFANWLHNDQPTGVQANATTEDGAYTLTPAGLQGNTIERNKTARVFVPSADEWYKAAYYDRSTMTYYDYPAGFDTQVSCTEPGAETNTAACGSVGDVVPVGGFTGSASPYGSFDQGGNVAEWVEEIVDPLTTNLRGLWGGSVDDPAEAMLAGSGGSRSPDAQLADQGLRVASRVGDIEWVTIEGPANAADSTGYGAVTDSFQIGKYETTNAQYALFLNAVARSDPNALYVDNMGTGVGGIVRNGTPGSYEYSVIEGREHHGAFYISYVAAMRFLNWLHNGRPIGAQNSNTTEDGAYTIDETELNYNRIERNPGARFFIPSEDQWYKAAYYDPVSQSYYDYPANSDDPTTCAAPSRTANTASCEQQAFLIDVGSYTGSPGPYGTFDQGGGIGEWTEGRVDIERVLRGGYFRDAAEKLAASSRTLLPAYRNFSYEQTGFRIARVPEPVTGLLQITALLGLACLRRLRA